MPVCRDNSRGAMIPVEQISTQSKYPRQTSIHAEQISTWWLNTRRLGLQLIFANLWEPLPDNVYRRSSAMTFLVITDSVKNSEELVIIKQRFSTIRP